MDEGILRMEFLGLESSFGWRKLFRVAWKIPFVVIVDWDGGLLAKMALDLFPVQMISPPDSKDGSDIAAP